VEVKVHVLAQGVQWMLQECNECKRNVALLKDALKREREEVGQFYEKLQVAEHQATLLHGRLMQVEQQQVELTTDRNAGLADVMPRPRSYTGVKTPIPTG
jgi:hypothetical protein